jgi:hypothetical protein
MNHGKCSGLRASAAPLRLLAVRGGDIVQLTKTDGQHLQYAALSYCRGSSEAIESTRTLASNLEFRLKNGFTLSSLPRTLQDGIIVARRLSIPYIWIDALCIVQDSEKEWETEAKKIQCYEHAYVRIVAISATSADEGFLYNKTSYVHLALTNAWNGEPGRVLHFSYPRYDDISFDVENSIWNNRGWTLQERLLSGRLIFTIHGTWFECRGASWTQRPEVAVGCFVTKFLPTSTARRPEEIFTAVKSCVESSSAWREWYTIVIQYTKRKLTNTDDRLPAISGISANLSQNLNAGVYLLGLWKEDICRGLLWRRPALRLDVGVFHHQLGVYSS